MQPCTVVRCGVSTTLRCGACGTLAFCSLGCAQEEWPEHRSGCFGALAKRKDKDGNWLPAPEPVLGEDMPARSKYMGKMAAIEERVKGMGPDEAQAAREKAAEAARKRGA